MRNLFRYIYILFVVVTATAGLCSCQDDGLRGDVPYTEGEPMTLSLSVSVPQMTVQSRANIEDNELYTVKNVWIGVFNANTGEMTSYGDDGKIGWKKIENVEVLGEHVLRAVPLRTKTGSSRIVAVANLDNQGTLSDRSRTGTLRELLDGVRTWDDFLKVGVNTFSAETENVYLNEIDRPNTDNGIPMAGCYYESRDSDPGSPADWIEQGVKTVNIQEATKTDLANGAIHLRRTISHITFNIRYGDKMIDFEPVGFKVCNAPRYSKFYEADATNFGDVVTKDNIGEYFVDANYPDRLYIDDLEATQTNPNPGYAFDFWMAENKHEGIIKPTATDETKKYNLREERHPKPNHSLFTSLLPTAEFGPNNTAAYVEISAYVTYKEKLYVGDDGQEISGGTEVTRSGLVTYTVHLGYIKRNYNDFNNYRNCNYTYNMQVNGLEDVRLEAIRESVRNGVEGTVSDVEHDVITLDSHFHQFNVRFTETELSFPGESEEETGQKGFGFTIVAFDNNVAHTFTEESLDALSKDEYKYLDWVEIKSTTNATTMARYIPPQKPAGMETGTYNSLKDNNGGAVMTLREFYKKLKDNQGRLSSVFTKTGQYYYFTVFIKEYVYEEGPEDAAWGNEEGGSWHTYVNQPNRRCYLRVRRHVSGDEQSVYARSLFSIEQRSIQTFYNNFSGSGAISPTAFGMEHTNETEGLNLRSTAPWGQTLSNVNGRLNTSYWITNRDNTRLRWSRFVSQTSELQVSSVSSLQGGPDVQSLASGWNPASGNTSANGFAHVPALVQFSGTIYETDSRGNVTTDITSAYDPQASSQDGADYIEAINACMNRNRDEDGDGVIDNEEIKWYVPASGKYMRAILGRNSMENPIMPYKKVTAMPNSLNEYNTRYLIYCSDNMILWAMEGLSMGGYNSHYPWQVRCIRNLGTNLKTITNTDKVTRAYEHEGYSSTSTDGAEGKFKMTYYDPKSVRTKKFTASGNGNVTTSFSNLSTSAYYPDAATLGNVNYMPIHDVTHPYNMVYKAFEYTPVGGPIAKPSNELITLIWGYSNGNSNPCYSKGKGWRLPNQKELAIMRNYGLFDGIGGGSYALSCTYNFFTRQGVGTDHKHSGFMFEYASVYDSDDKQYYTILLPQHKFILTRSNGGTQSQEEKKVRNFYYRCVRDVEP